MDINNMTLDLIVHYLFNTCYDDSEVFASIAKTIKQREEERESEES